MAQTAKVNQSFGSNTLAIPAAAAYDEQMTPNATLTTWLSTLGSAVEASQFVKLTLSKPSAAAGDLKSVDVRPILVKRELKLSFTYHHKTRDIVKNYPPSESMALLASLCDTQFNTSRLCTTEADLTLTKSKDGYALTRQKPTHTTAPELTHDRAKHRLIKSENNHYLHALGITDAKGNVYKTTQDKFRQINKYIEILDGLLKRLPPNDSLRIIDMGAGKGYLTFALYDHILHNIKRTAEVIGVEYRADLVTQCNTIAQAQGFTGLQFIQGSIADYDCSGADVVIALHACDTATDDAIAKAIHANASLIVVAPCCHKQIRRDMTPAANHALDFMLKFGTYSERLAEMITDGMRAQLMEQQGYRTNLFEFIADAHTPKNVMIVATRSKTPTAQDTEKLNASLTQTKAQFGIPHHHLETLLK